MLKRYTTALALLVALVLAISGPALAGVIVTGEIQGASCIVTGTRCPADKADPYIVLEPDFVLLTDDGQFYFMPNLDRAVKARYVGMRVKATGDLQGQVLEVDKLEVKKLFKYKTVWSKEMQRKLWEERLEN